MTNADAPAPARRRRRLRPVEVAAVENLSPRLVSISFTGQLDGFEAVNPTSHIKIMIPQSGERHVQLPEPGPDGQPSPADGPRPQMRTYTPRAFDPGTGRLEVQFVIHGEGPASDWAERAQVGDRLAIAGPGGRFNQELNAGPWLIGGDESAVPAIGTLLDTIPADAVGDVFIETATGLPIVDLVAPERVQVHWLQAAEDAPGERLREALATANITAEQSVWVACESVAVRRIRHDLLETSGLDRSKLTTRGYWRLGQANHPDHDYGED